MLDLLERHGHLTLAAETGLRRFGTGAYGFWRAHVAALLMAAGVGLETKVLGDNLLAPLAAELYRINARPAGSPRPDIARGLALLATRVLDATAPIEMDLHTQGSEGRRRAQRQPGEAITDHEFPRFDERSAHYETLLRPRTA